MARRKRADRLRPGDAVVLHVERVLGVRGRKPSDGRAPLVEVVYDDGSRVTLRGDARLEVAPRSRRDA